MKHNNTIPLYNNLKKISDSINTVLRPFMDSPQWVIGKLICNWETIIGPEYAQQTFPVSLKRGLLTVEIPLHKSMDWQYSAPTIIARVNSYLKDDYVIKIRTIPHTKAYM